MTSQKIKTMEKSADESATSNGPISEPQRKPMFGSAFTPAAQKYTSLDQIAAPDIALETGVQVGRNVSLKNPPRVLLDYS